MQHVDEEQRPCPARSVRSELAPSPQPPWCLPPAADKAMLRRMALELSGGHIKAPQQ